MPGPNVPKPARLRGLALIGLGLVAVFSPFFFGSWLISLFGAVIAVAGLTTCVNAYRTPDRNARRTGFVSGGLAALLGILVFAGPNLVFSGVIAILSGLLLFEGLTRVAEAARGASRSRIFGLFNGLLLLLTAGIVWRFHSSAGLSTAGLALGIYCLSLGWTQLIAPTGGVEKAEIAASNEHPDARLGLAPHPEFGRLRAEAIAGEEQRHAVDIYWMSVLVALFLLIHIGRTGMHISTLGLITPALATVGDVLCAALVGGLLVVPARLVWRRLTRPLERAAWTNRLAAGDPESLDVGERLTRRWLDARLRFDVRMRIARGSLSAALWDIMEAGLPAIAFLVAFNPIWGFSWYFNTENWASGFWDKITSERTDPWRVAMTQAVEKAYPGIPPGRLFALDPPGSITDRDFSFIVIGDTGEGDSSQLSLSYQLAEVASRPEVKFVAVSSDVIYPDGAMEDYEFKFYLPFHGVKKPIYAIPGNHDWYNQLDSFCANFMEPAAARASMQARIHADLGFTVTTAGRVDSYIAQAAELRREYQVANGFQRAPFFEIHYPGFSFIAVDTGVIRRIDTHQATWLRAALERSRGSFTMALLGHPLYAGGIYQAAEDPDFNAIHQLLREFEVPLVMAGDTHDFEFYRETYPTASGPRDMVHFVNGGGGAYLSIGTSMDWPASPPVVDWAYYPSTAAVAAKLVRETPAWKRPIWWWLHRWKGWPTSAEVLSAAFDFNQAPFFQSFMEIRVESSQNRVRLLLYGANGQLRWRDLQLGGNVKPATASLDELVEFTIPLRAPAEGIGNN